MVSFNKLTRTLAGIAAAALIVPLAACGGSGNGGTATAEGIPAKGTDDGTEITLTCSRATLRPAPWTAPSTPCRSSPMFP